MDTYMKHFKEEVLWGHGVNVQLLSLDRFLEFFNLVVFTAIQQVKNGLKKSTDINDNTKTFCKQCSSSPTASTLKKD